MFQTGELNYPWFGNSYTGTMSEQSTESDIQVLHEYSSITENTFVPSVLWVPSVL